MAQNALPWVEKHRPASLSALSEQSYVTDTVLKLVSTGLLPHLLFYGPPGTGKTTTILAMARHCYGAQLGEMTLELNASDDRGISVIRSEIQSFAASQRLFNAGYKLVILDECDNMTKDAQFALRRIIEKYTRHTRFCLIGNYASKIIPALQSRCMKFRFAPFSTQASKEALATIAKAEHVSITDSAISAIIKYACGDLRRACNLLQSCALSSSSDIEDTTVFSVSGMLRPSDIDALLRSVLNDSLNNVITAFAAVVNLRNGSLANIIPELQDRLFEMHLPAGTRGILFRALADAEMSLSLGCSEKLQTRSLGAAFVSIRRENMLMSINANMS